jgi:hypothetical protein|tara:strand:+ start:171 stop:521 length:351 start_codon:yes stop_codon:yes gene_type:complete
MDLLAMSDSELMQLADPIYNELIEASNSRNLDAFTKHMPNELINDEIKQDIEEQWDNVPFLTALSEKKEFLGLLRRKSTIHVLWKQWSEINDTQYLGVLVLKNINGKVKSNGFFIK